MVVHIPLAIPRPSEISNAGVERSMQIIPDNMGTRLICIQLCVYLAGAAEVSLVHTLHIQLTMTLVPIQWHGQDIM